MANRSSLHLEIATPEDISTLTDVWFAAFTHPDFRLLWPDTLGVRQWWDDANRNDMLKKPFQHYIKVVDPSSTDASGRARIVGYAKWDLSMPDKRGRRYPPWHSDMPGEVLDAFFQKEEEQRLRIMGNETHYYLDTVATHPDHQRRGVGSMLVKWGCDRADEDGVAAYVDASQDGAPLYEKFGFVDRSEPGTGDIASMVRERQV